MKITLNFNKNVPKSVNIIMVVVLIENILLTIYVLKYFQ